MSATSSVGSSGSSLYTLLQTLNDTTNSATSASAISSTDPTADDSTTASASSTKKTHHHHHGVSSRVESAVTSALQSAPDGSDPNQVVKDALTKVLQDGSTGTSDPSDPSAPATSAAAAPSQPGDFSKLLQSYGINSQQFEQDLQSSFQNSTDGTPDFSKLFKSFPPGSAIETAG